MTDSNSSATAYAIVGLCVLLIFIPHISLNNWVVNNSFKMYVYSRMYSLVYGCILEGGIELKCRSHTVFIYFCAFFHLTSIWEEMYSQK